MSTDQHHRLPTRFAALADEDVLGLVASGDEDALAELYDRYRSLLMALALRIVGEVAEAEDVVQDALLQVCRQAARYDPERSSVSTWLVLIARSRALDRKRRQTTSARVHERLASDATVVDTSSSGETSVLTRERRERLRRALAELPPEQREALELAYYGGLTQSEVAAQTDTPLGTVKTRTMLALRKLRRALAGEIGELL